MEEDACIKKFKSLKYETRTEVEQRQVEELVLSKLGKWKYSPDQIAYEISNELLEKLKPRWEFSTQIVKDIYVQTLRKFLPSIIDAEVKESLKKNEDKMTLRFNTCLVLVKDIECIVKSSTKTWKNFYHFHNPSDFPVDVKDDEDEEGKDEEDDEGSTHYLATDYEEYKE